MKKLLTIIVGFLVSPVVFVLCSYTLTFPDITITFLSFFLLPLGVGLSVPYFEKHGITFLKYWIPISLAFLYLLTLVIGYDDNVLGIINGVLLCIGYLIGSYFNKASWLKIGLTITIGLTLIVFVVEPLYSKHLFSNYYLKTKIIPDKKVKLNLKEAKILNVKNEKVDINDLFSKEENIVFVTFSGCKGCVDQLNYIGEHISEITTKKNLIVFYDGSLDDFDDFEKKSKKIYEIEQFYDSAGIITNQVQVFKERLYPLKFIVTDNLDILEYSQDYMFSYRDLYLKELLDE